MTSIWLDESRPEIYPTLEEDTSADVAVVGAGIAGIATAYQLSRGGARVIVLDARFVAEAASGRNAGFLLAGVAENFVAAAHRYGEDRARRVWRFTKHNQRLVRELVAREDIDCELGWNGSLQIAGDDAEWSEVRESAARLAGEGIRVRLLPDARAAIYVEDGDFHPVRYVRGLARAAAAGGARLCGRTPVSAVTADDVRTDRARVRAGAVVVCVNAYSRHLLPLRVRPVRGQMLATAPVTRHIFERPACANRGYRYWRQRADGRLLVGGWRDTAVDEEVGEEERTTARVQTELERFLHERAPEATITHRWAGIMGFSHDALPYVGRLASGVFVNAGFTGHGMAFATATGELVADLVRGASRDETDLFAPERP
ncbi:MAG TPA: FAD-dependent oxidoreductase [Candidatus Limnocylindria bacterium]|jgi:glycine/D-amino acid oxidase-like deaminating enzyme|nr:FAD-dependent oxidoreductase [Candidatus Limnocylindria bacterium]